MQNRFPELFCQLVVSSITCSRGNPWLHVLVPLLELEVKHRALCISLRGQMRWNGQQVLPRTVWEGICLQQRAQ